MKTKITFLTFSMLFCFSIYAQKSDKSIPKSVELKLNDNYSLSSTKKTFEKLNISALQKEDEEDEKNGLPPRFGYPLDVSLNTTNSGTWKNLSNGDRIWRLELECTDAISINLLYDEFWLPERAKFYLYSKDKSQVIGGFNSTNNRGTRKNPGKFTTGLLFSQSIILELYEPKVVKNQSILSIDKVVYGYREIDLKSMMTNEAGHGDSGSCQVNINCSEGQNWQNEKKGVAMFLVNGIRWCTGSLINNTANNKIPYFLTADHCIGNLDANGDTDASYYSFWWNYESSVCNPNSTDFIATSTSGATLIANNSASDFALFQLTESPIDNNLDVFFNGWDRTTNPTLGGAGIHHPRGDFKKIATHNVIPTSGQVYGASTHWRVNWSQTTNGFSVTEYGSSGSPLFTNDKRIIGQLHGGSSINCSDPAKDPGEYGRFHISWEGSSPQRRLKDWLDPLNTNQSYLNGIGTINFQNELDVICYNNSKTLNLNNIQNHNVIWQASSNISILSSSNNSINIKASSSNSSGIGWVSATLSNGNSIQEDFWVGKPQITTVPYTTPSGPGSNPNYICSYIDLIGTNNMPIVNQGITNINWTKIYSNGQCNPGFSGSGFHGSACGSCDNWIVQVKITATNSCGQTIIYRNLAPPRREPTRKSYRISSTSKNIYEVIKVLEPLDENLLSNTKEISQELENVSISVFNHFGIKLIDLNKKSVDISYLKNGIYFMKAIVNNKEVLSLKIKK